VIFLYIQKERNLLFISENRENIFFLEIDPRLFRSTRKRINQSCKVALWNFHFSFYHSFEVVKEKSDLRSAHSRKFFWAVTKIKTMEREKKYVYFKL